MRSDRGNGDDPPVRDEQRADTVQIAPGVRYLSFATTEPGKWIFHRHIGHHLTDDGEGPRGLIMTFDFEA